MRHTVDAGIVFPVYVRELDNGDVIRYDKPDQLAALEAIDVDNGEYAAWDALGRRLKLTAVGMKRFSGGNVDFRLDRDDADLGFGNVVEAWAKSNGRT